MNKKKASQRLYLVAVILFLISGAMVYKGYDKITNYYLSEHVESLNVNAYVGGDAYNYIINGNYATGYFVLSMGFFMSGILCICAGMIINVMPENQVQIIENHESTKNYDEEIPEL